MQILARYIEYLIKMKGSMKQLQVEINGDWYDVDINADILESPYQIVNARIIDELDQDECTHEHPQFQILDPIIPKCAICGYILKPSDDRCARCKPQPTQIEELADEWLNNPYSYAKKDVLLRNMGKKINEIIRHLNND